MPKHIAYLLIGSFCGIYIGIVAGWQLSKHHLKPLMISEHNQKKFVDAENKKLQKVYIYYAVEIEALSQEKRAVNKFVREGLGLDIDFKGEAP